MIDPAANLAPAITPALTLVLTLGQSLPQGGTVPLAVALGAGIALWLFGAKLVKPVFLLLGLAIGGFVGATLVPMTGIPPFDLGPVTMTPGITGVLIGGIIGALVALALFRVVITMTAALAFAAAGLMGALIFLHFNPTTDPTTPDTDPDQAQRAAQVDSAPNSAANGAANRVDDQSINRDAAQRSLDALSAAQGSELLDDQTRQDLLDAAERSRVFVKRATNAIGAELDKRPMRDKTIAFSSMFGGLALGLLVGITMPNRTAALVTALLGSAVWIGATTALLTARNGALPDALDRSPIAWGAAWILLTLVGLLVQLGFFGRGSKTESEQASED